MSKLNVPPELKKISQFIRRAEELDNDTTRPESRIVAYYCRQYAVLVGIPFANPPAAKACLSTLLTQLEKERPVISQFTRKEAEFLIRKFANNVFDKADNEDRMGGANKNTARTFYAAAVFFEILQQFYNSEQGGGGGGGEGQNLTEEQDEDTKKRVYSKWKATDILKAIKEGRNVVPGGYGELKDTHAQLQAIQPEGMDWMETPVVQPPPRTENMAAAFSQPDEKGEHGIEVTGLGPIPQLSMVGIEPSDTFSSKKEDVPSKSASKNQENKPDSKATSVSHRPPLPSTTDIIGTYSPSLDTVSPSAPPAIEPSPSAPLITQSPSSLSATVSSFFGLGKSKSNHVSKEDIADAAELAKFALKALESQDVELGTARLEDALGCLGKR